MDPYFDFLWFDFLLIRLFDLTSCWLDFIIDVHSEVLVNHVAMNKYVIFIYYTQQLNESWLAYWQHESPHILCHTLLSRTKNLPISVNICQKSGIIVLSVSIAITWAYYHFASTISYRVALFEYAIHFWNGWHCVQCRLSQEWIAYSNKPTLAASKLAMWD